MSSDTKTISQLPVADPLTGDELIPIVQGGVTKRAVLTGIINPGTITSVSVATANGVSGTVANPTSTPAISLSLGNITPTSVAASGNVTGSNLSGSNTGDQTLSDATISTSDNVTNNVSITKHGFAPKAPNDATKFLDGTGSYSVPSGAGSVTAVSVTTVNGVSGTVANPTTTPAISLTLGAIIPTSVAASGTVTGSNLSGSHSGASSGTNTGDQSLAGYAVTASPLSQFALTTSAQLASVLSDETGSGAAVFATSPTLVTPALGIPTALVLTNATGLPVAGGGTGVAALTAFAPLFGGVTTTDPVQSGTAGTAGQVLTSNGAGVLPTFQAAAAPSSSLDLVSYSFAGGF